MSQKKAIVLVSGGLDSATVLAMAKQQDYACYGLSFDYGQRHRSELNAAKQLAAKMGVVEYRVMQSNMGEWGGSALTDHDIDVPAYQADDHSVPITYVPARNTLFLSMALGWAELIEADAIFAGMSAVDYSGYPDCRPAFMEAFQNLINVATRITADEGHQLTLMTPLMHLSKAETIMQGISLGVDYADTVSCYSANEQGQACGACDSCCLRRKGFEKAGVSDPTRYY